MASVTSCVVFPHPFHLYMQGGHSADGTLVCTLAKVTSLCYSQPGFAVNF